MMVICRKCSLLSALLFLLCIVSCDKNDDHKNDLYGVGVYSGEMKISYDGTFRSIGIKSVDIQEFESVHNKGVSITLKDNFELLNLMVPEIMIPKAWISIGNQDKMTYSYNGGVKMIGKTAQGELASIEGRADLDAVNDRKNLEMNIRFSIRKDSLDKYSTVDITFKGVRQ